MIDTRRTVIQSAGDGARDTLKRFRNMSPLEWVIWKGNRSKNEIKQVM